MRYPLRVARRVGDGHRPSVKNGEQSEPLQAQAVCHSLQIQDMGIQ